MPNTLVNPSKFILHRVSFRCISTIVFWLSLTTLLYSQRPNYSIEVTLDTMTHELTGFEVITYRNQTPGTLDSLGIHLWANAYADKNSTFAKQLLNLGLFDFKAARPDELGGYQQINFSSTGDSLNFRYEKDQKDVGWIIFSKPLLPGEEISIKASFVIKVPLSFSRMGRTDDSYQFTQWYPHIAVYDLEGWHTMPYLDQGEYFNDFADYQVSITVPSRYIIASTGMIKNKQEKGELTTWHFTAENVIDFAWFASPHFRVTEKNIQVENGTPFLLSIYADTLSPDPWDSVIFFAERTLKFYSDWLGPYPYPHMSVVSAPWSKGGFMEYPMLAQIGPHNAITDVEGVRVGYSTIVHGDGPLLVGQGPVRTGVTVVLPHGGRPSIEPVFAGYHRLNGFGELTGLEWLHESGMLSSPIALTNTDSVGRRARHAHPARDPGARAGCRSCCPSSARPGTASSTTSAASTCTAEHVHAAHDDARGGPIAEGNVGAGTGTQCYGFKGGIGTASRVVELGQRRFTIGVLVQANHGDRKHFEVNGVPIGHVLTEEGRALPAMSDDHPGPSAGHRIRARRRRDRRSAAAPPAAPAGPARRRSASRSSAPAATTYRATS